MDRKAIKAEAKEKIKGNLWTIWKPILALGLISGVIGGVLGAVLDPESAAYSALSLVTELLLMPISVGVIAYMLKFTRGEKPEFNDIFGYYKYFLPIVAITLLVGFFTGLATIAFIIPGIIVALMLCMSYYIVADGKTDVFGVLKESKELMYGHKWEFFVFLLSFLGWILLVCITFGIAAIYVVPYMQVAECIYYDKLKALKK